VVVVGRFIKGFYFFAGMEKERIIVVEGGSDIWKVCVSFLERTGSYSVSCIPDVRDTLAFANFSGVDGFLSNILVPGVCGGENGRYGGLDILEYAVQNDKKAVFMTGGNVPLEVTSEIKEAGFPIFHKPFDMRAILQYF